MRLLVLLAALHVLGQVLHALLRVPFQPLPESADNTLAFQSTGAEGVLTFAGRDSPST